MEADWPTTEGTSSEAHGVYHRHGELGRDPPSRPRRRPERSAPPAASTSIHWKTLKKILDPPRAARLPPHQSRSGPRSSSRSCRSSTRSSRTTGRPRGSSGTPPSGSSDRLRDEHGYRGGLTVVKDAVRAWRRRTAEVFVPLAHPPGEAQADFGEAEVTLDGRPAKVAVFVMTLPYSDAIFCLRLPARVHRGVPRGPRPRLRLLRRRPPADQLRQPQDRRRQDHRQPRSGKLTGEFLRLAEPPPLRGPLLPGAAAQREGARRDAGRLRPPQLPRAGPVPCTAAWRALNARLEADCRADLARRLRGKPATKAELLAEERAAMLPLPAEAFLAARVEQPTADSLSLVRFDTNDYSVPTEYAHRRVTAVGTVDAVRIAVGDRVVADHRRCWGREGVFYDPVHYLALLERKPGALDFAAPLAGWELPVCFGVLRRRLEAEFGGPGTRQFIKVLRLLEWASLRGADPGRRAGVGAGHGRRRRGAADPGAPAGAAGGPVLPRRPAAPEAGRRPGPRPLGLREPDGGGGAMRKTETKSTVLLKHHLKALKLPTMTAECEKVARAVRRRGRRPPGLPAPAVRAGADRAGAAGGASGG